jgi:hypothetical protein
MTAFADLILPDTTYLERHDVMSMLDRPISEFDGPVDSVRIPVVPVSGDCKPFQEVLIELGTRLKLPAFTTKEGERKFRDYPDFVVNWESEPGSGIGFLAGWRGKGGEKSLRGDRTRTSGRCTRRTTASSTTTAEVLPVHAQLEQGLPRMVAAQPHHALRRADPDPHLLRGAATLPAAAQGKGFSRKPPEHLKSASRPISIPALLLRSARSAAHRQAQVSAGGGDAAADGDVPLLGFAERLAAPDPHPQLPLRQCADRAAAGHRGRRLDLGRVAMGQGALHGAPLRGRRAGHGVDLERDRQGAGAWNLTPDANESQKGLPAQPPDLGGTAGGGGAARISNSDPITGQAAWYDVRVRI